MNREWAQKHKTMQTLLKKNTFSQGIRELIGLRSDLMEEILSWKTLPAEAFCAIPFLGAEGYHSKTVAYSLWHIFRIEDIVVNSLIRQKEEVLFSEGFDRTIHAPLVTTGNELRGQEIADFSRRLDLDALYVYIQKVRETTDRWLLTLDYETSKRTFDASDKQRLCALGVVSGDEEAAWLIDYWCGKDVRGLLKMPLSRHWIMHIEASIRILDKIHTP